MIKKRIPAALACMLLILSVIGLLPVGAVDQKVYDDANLLTAEERQELQNAAASLAEEVQMLSLIHISRNENTATAMALNTVR